VLHFEDLAVGQVYSTFGVTITEESVIRFALEYDFQPFHIDKVAAQDSIFGGLIASGLQTLALTFRLCNQAQLFAGNAVAGIGLDDVRFLRPVHAGDTIRAVVTVAECRTSASLEHQVDEPARSARVQGDAHQSHQAAGRGRDHRGVLTA
jgi:acyl dehydratase